MSTYMIRVAAQARATAASLWSRNLCSGGGHLKKLSNTAACGTISFLPHLSLYLDAIIEITPATWLGAKVNSCMQCIEGCGSKYAS